MGSFSFDKVSSLENQANLAQMRSSAQLLPYSHRKSPAFLDSRQARDRVALAAENIPIDQREQTRQNAGDNKVS